MTGAGTVAVANKKIVDEVSDREEERGLWEGREGEGRV